MWIMPILRARDIALSPDQQSADDLRAAHHSLVSSAALNRDRTRAAEDVALAATLEPLINSQT